MDRDVHLGADCEYISAPAAPVKPAEGAAKRVGLTGAD
jgi:hypothetical protein